MEDRNSEIPDDVPTSQKLRKNQADVILSAAKDLRSFLWLNDLRTTTEMLRCHENALSF
jgi:hypothetical protein